MRFRGGIAGGRKIANYCSGTRRFRFHHQIQCRRVDRDFFPVKVSKVGFWL